MLPGRPCAKADAAAMRSDHPDPCRDPTVTFAEPAANAHVPSWGQRCKFNVPKTAFMYDYKHFVSMLNNLFQDFYFMLMFLSKFLFTCSLQFRVIEDRSAHSVLSTA